MAAPGHTTVLLGLGEKVPVALLDGMPSDAACVRMEDGMARFDPAPSDRKALRAAVLWVQLHREGTVDIPTHPLRARAQVEACCLQLDQLMVLDTSAASRPVLRLNANHAALTGPLRRLQALLLGTLGKKKGDIVLSLEQIRERHAKTMPEPTSPRITPALLACLPFLSDLAILPLDAHYETVIVSAAAQAVARRCIKTLAVQAMQIPDASPPLDVAVVLDRAKAGHQMHPRNPLSPRWLRILQPRHGAMLVFSDDGATVRRTQSPEDAASAVFNLLRYRRLTGVSAHELCKIVPDPASLLEAALVCGRVLARVDKDKGVRYYWIGEVDPGSQATHIDDQFAAVWNARQPLDLAAKPGRICHLLISKGFSYLDSTAWTRRKTMATSLSTLETSASMPGTTSTPLSTQALRRSDSKRRRPVSPDRPWWLARQPR